MASVLISVAHSRWDHGTATKGGISEYSLAAEQAPIIEAVLRDAHHDVQVFDASCLTHHSHNPAGLLEAKIRKANEKPWDLVIEVHHNDMPGGDVPKNNGYVVYYHDSKPGALAALAVSDELHRVMPWPIDEPRRDDDKRLWRLDPVDGKAKPYRLAFLCRTCRPALIIEPGYLDHVDSDLFYDSERNTHAEAEAIGIGINHYLPAVTRHSER
jgi:N-acetylmuramoyl-L-alanine amidase